jgi:hypothetical protein
MSDVSLQSDPKRTLLGRCQLSRFHAHRRHWKLAQTRETAARIAENFRLRAAETKSGTA